MYRGCAVTRRVAVAAAVLAAALLTGCGVPEDPAPRQITPPPGPYQALAATPAPASVTGTVAQPLCLVRGDSLVPVVRWTPAAAPVDAVVRDLLAGPTAAERAAGLRSALTGVDLVAGVRLTDATATVELERDLAAGRNDQVLAFGQLVCTLTARPEVARVDFQRAGQRISVPRADGSLSSGPLTVTDYASIIAPP